jgi:RHS repeat-associated protein
MFGEVDAYTAAVDGNPVYGYTVDERDKLGRIVRKTETIQGVSTQYEYGYDPAGRLADVWRLSAPPAHLAHYGYDLNGNRTGGFNQLSGTIVPASGPSGGTRYDDQDRLEQYETAVDGVVTYTYTANGELATKTDAIGQTTYTYDAFGNLRTVALPGGSTIEYLVDGRNRRIGKVVDGSFVQGFLYQDQLEPVAELGPDGAVVAQFVYGSKPHVSDYMIRYGATSGTYRIISDHLGSPVLVIDLGTGAIVQRIQYDEFGNTVSDTNPGLQPFGFSGSIRDGDHPTGTGFSRFGGRDYSPSIGRWTVKDPVRFDGGTNLYAYSLQDPINLIDRNGQGPALATAVAGFCLAYDAVNVASAFIDPEGLDESFHTLLDQIRRIDERRSNCAAEKEAELLSERRELERRVIDVARQIAATSSTVAEGARDALVCGILGAAGFLLPTL